MESADVVVIGAGFGGLSAALHLAEAGRDVVLFEGLNYPGGCASTFTRKGETYASGATMFAGFGPGGAMQRVLDRFDLDVPTRLLDPVLDYRAGDLDVTLLPERRAFIEALCSLPGARAASIEAFFAELVATADPLWALFERPELLPPLSPRSLASHLKRMGQYLPLLKGVTRPLGDRLAAHGLSDFAPLRHWLDSACQITVQTTSDVAEAPVAMAAVDYFWRGCAEVEGGVGTLAWAFAKGIERRGARLRFAERVTGLRRVRGQWEVQGRKGVVRAPQVVANLLPQDVDGLRGEVEQDRLVGAVRQSWGAAMLYLQVEDVGLAPGPLHLQLRDGGSTEGQLVLVSVAPSEGTATRSVTVSTHLPIEEPMAERVEVVQQRMRQTLALRAPELVIRSEMTGSPRTFQRFTRREQGRVGGVPRVAGLRNYLKTGPQERAPGLWLVGDSVFPGQSVLAVTLAGNRVAAAITGRASASSS